MKYLLTFFDAYVIFNILGNDITVNLMKLLESRICVKFNNYQIDLVRDIKEKLCKIKANPQQEEILYDTNNNSYELPDGKLIVLDNECIFSSPEYYLITIIILPNYYM